MQGVVWFRSYQFSLAIDREVRLPPVILWQRERSLVRDPIAVYFFPKKSDLHAFGLFTYNLTALQRTNAQVPLGTFM